MARDLRAWFLTLPPLAALRRASWCAHCRNALAAVCQRWEERRYIGSTVRMSCSPRVVMASK